MTKNTDSDNMDLVTNVIDSQLTTE